MSDDIDIFANIDNLTDSVSLAFESSQESPIVPLTGESVEISDGEVSTNDTLSLSDVSEKSKLVKKGQNLLQRYEKKKQMLAKKQQKKMSALRTELLHSTPNSTPKRRTRAREGGGVSTRRTRQSQPETPEIDDYISIGSPDSPQRENFPQSASVISISSMELSREVDHEITIKLKWKDKIERIQYRQLQPFRDFIQMLSERANTEPKNIVLTMNETMISARDTPSSIGYTSVDFIYGRVVMRTLSPQKKAPEIELKIQSDRWKRPLAVKVDKEANVQFLLEMCAKALKCTTTDIRLKFDGELLNPSMTVHDLDLEGGEILDVAFNVGRK